MRPENDTVRAIFGATHHHFRVSLRHQKGEHQRLGVTIGGVTARIRRAVGQVLMRTTQLNNTRYPGCSASTTGPKVNAGRKDKDPTTTTVAKTIAAKSNVSSGSDPAVFARRGWAANRPASNRAIAPVAKRPASMAIAVVTL